jgi:hypothetical protein
LRAFSWRWKNGKERLRSERTVRENRMNRKTKHAPCAPFRGAGRIKRIDEAVAE